MGNFTRSYALGTAKLYVYVSGRDVSSVAVLQVKSLVAVALIALGVVAYGKTIGKYVEVAQKHLPTILTTKAHLERTLGELASPVGTCASS